LVEQVVTILGRLGWEVATEVTFAIYVERGAIDVLAWHARSAIVLVIEVKTVVPDPQGMLSAFDRKIRLAMTIACERGWPAKSVARLLVVAEGRTGRRRIEAHRETFAALLPDRAVAIRRWFRSPGGRPLRGLWFLSYDTPAPVRRAAGSATHSHRAGKTPAIAAKGVL
jgi:hypothetical protein